MIPRRTVWIVASIATGCTAAAIAGLVWLGPAWRPADSSQTEVASAQRLAEEWLAVREAWNAERAGELVDQDDAEGDEMAVPVVDDSDDDAADASPFGETPDWLVYVVERKASLSEDEIEEATP